MWLLLRTRMAKITHLAHENVFGAKAGYWLLKLGRVLKSFANTPQLVVSTVIHT
jgi:hypothetical protein